MKTIDCQTFFATYVDPLRAEAAEWGAFAGLHGTDRARGEEQIRILARTALARAGFAVPADLESAKEGLASLESGQRAMRGELQTAWRKLTGVQPFNSTRRHGVIVEAAMGLFAIPSLALTLLTSAPIRAYRRRQLERTERKEGLSAQLRQGAEDILIVEYEWQFLKGEEARKRRTGSPVRVAAAGEGTGKEDRLERSARVARQ